MVVSKQINLKVTPRMQKRLEEEKEAGGFASMSELLEEAVRYYLDRDKHNIIQKEAFKQFLLSEEGELWISSMIDKDLMKRASKQFGLDQS